MAKMTRGRSTEPMQSEPSTYQPKLVVPHSQARQKLEEHIMKGRELSSRIITSEEEMKMADADGDKWRNYAIRLLTSIFDTLGISAEFNSKTRSYMGLGDISYVEARKLFKDQMDGWWIKELDSILESIELYPETTASQHENTVSRDMQAEAIENIERIAKRFHIVARQLQQRYNDRSTLKIENEYDVQDLFHTLLKLYFDDIRNEEWTPSYAGGHSRIDFLLKEEQIAIEIKMTRQGLKAREVSDQLIIDITRYRSAHPDCKMLIAFVYDPDGFINNPRGIERDLSKETDGMQVKVIINPH